VDGIALDRQPMDGEPVDGFAVDCVALDGFTLDRRAVGQRGLGRQPLDRQPLDGCLVELPGLGIDRRATRSTRTSDRIGFRIAPLIVVQLVLATVVTAFSRHAHQRIGPPAVIVLFALGFAAAGAFNMRLEFRRHQFTFTLAEAVLSASFFTLGPIGVGIAAAVGEGVSLGAQRVSPLKTAYNVGNRLASTLVAAAAFQAFAHTRADDATAWAVAIGAALLFSCFDTIFTAAVLATVERSRFQTVLAQSVPTAALTTLGGAPLGVIAVSLSRRSPLAPLLLVPLIAVVMFNSRHAAAQRDEHLRFERLHEASSRTAHVVDLHDALRMLATEAIGLATGLGAICCTTDADGEWIGVTVDEHGRSHRSPTPVVRELRRLGARGLGREIALDRAMPALSGVFPDAASIVLARGGAEGAAPIAMAVLREGNPDIGAPARVQALGAFANHASLTAANARLYAELEAALNRQVDLNRQKGDFVATVSHELRTPLAVMLAANHTLRKLADRIAEPKRLELLDASIENGARLQRLIDELLLVAAAEHQQAEVVRRETELEPLVAELEAELTPRTGGRLRVCAPRPLPIVMAEPDRLRQILLNVIDNATKYAPDGPIELHVTTVADGPEPHVRMAVVDHGPGIPEADRVRVFDQFVQLDQSSTRRQGGTGLGLYLCRQLAALIGGTLTLEPAADGGCCFTLTVAAAAAAAPAGDAEPPAAAPPAAGQRFANVRKRPASLGPPAGRGVPAPPPAQLLHAD
jgi:signal transduction histidine kinase